MSTNTLNCTPEYLIRLEAHEPAAKKTTMLLMRLRIKMQSRIEEGVMLFERNYRKELLQISKNLPSENIYVPDRFWKDLYKEYCAFENKGYKHYFDTEDQTMDSYAIHFTYNYLGDTLSSGKYHIYYGVLGPEGKELLKFYREIKKELIKAGAPGDDQERLDRIERTVIENIRGVG